MRNRVLFILVLLTFVSCTKKPCCTIIDTDFVVHYLDVNGNDLFKSDTSFSEAEIKIFYKQGDDFVYMNEANLDNPGMFDVNYDGDSNRFVTVFPSDYYFGNQSITLIQLKPTVIDTVLCEFDLREENQVLQKVWYNGVLANERLLEIVK